jgi:hypothetical protein
LNEFTGLVRQLNEIVTKVNTGEGVAGKLINDPSLYESINDVLIGINESRLLRWLIRNRQQAGIDRRYDEAQKTPTAPPPVPPPPPPPATDTAPPAPAEVPPTPAATDTAATDTTATTTPP